jgi:hypothetical protein
MATAKQLAARKLFVKRVRAGEFTRAANPAKKRTVKKSVTRPSQITKKAPSKRLKARRAMPEKKGYFPNPVGNKLFQVVKIAYAVTLPGETNLSHAIAAFLNKIEAVEYAQMRADEYGIQYAVRPFNT